MKKLVKVRIFVAIVVLISLLVLVGASMSCADGSETTDFAKNIPNDADECNFLDIKALRGDDNLEDLYVLLVGDSEELLTEYLGMDFNDIDSIVVCGDLTLVYGNFDIDYIRDNLDFDDEYKDVEILKSDGEVGWLALIGEDLIIIGSEESVKDCINVIKEEEGSLWDDQDYKDIMDRLPVGIVMIYGTDDEYPEEEAWGASLQKKDDNTLKMTVIFKFKDDNAAEDAMDEIEANAKEADVKNINVHKDGKFVIFTSEMEIDDLLATLPITIAP